MSINIESKSDLQTFANVAADEVAKLKGEVVRLKNDLSGVIGIQKSNFMSGVSTSASGRWTKEDSAGFGEALRKLSKNPHLKLGYDDLEEKASLGTMLTSDQSTGTSAVSVQYINSIIAMAAERSELYPLTTRIPMVARTAVYPKLSTEPVFTKLTTQSTDVTEAAPTFTTLDLTTRDYAFYIGFSHSFVQDNIIGLGAFMADRTAGALAKKIDNELLRSSSSPTGLLNSTSAQVVRLTGPNFQDVSEGDLVDMITALDQVQERDGACWIMHPQLLDTVMRIQNAQGDFIFREAQVLTKGWTRQILGYPVVLSNQMPRLSESTANTAFIALGNPKLFLYGDREAMSIRWLDRTSYFATNLEELFVAYFRAAMTISMEDSFCLLKTAA